uniref:Uncharacterized protein n=1 Tax=Caenorhabditis tropicalis TaxID=1561998 RepID=A0A1I7URH5_9PELO
MTSNEELFLKSVGNNIQFLSALENGLSLSMECLVLEGKEVDKYVAVKTHFEYIRISLGHLTKVLEEYGVNDQFKYLLERLFEKIEAGSLFYSFLSAVREKDIEWCEAIEKEYEILVKMTQKFKIKVSKDADSTEKMNKSNVANNVQQENLTEIEKGLEK